MSLSRKGKMWLAILGIPLVMVIAGVIVLKAVFTGERLKSMVIPRVEETTGRKVSIEDMSLSVFPSIALDMKGMTVSNLRAEGFSSDPLMTMESLRLNVKLLPLLGSRFEVTSLVMEGPRLLLEAGATGETNYSNLTTGGKAPDVSTVQAQKDADSSPGMALMVSSLLVNDGYVEYRDHKDSSVIKAGSLSLAMEIGGEEKTMIFTGNAVAESLSYGTFAAPFIEGMRLRLDHRILYDLAKDQVKFEKGDLTLQGLHLILAGRLSDVTKDPILDLTLGSDSLNIADLFSLIPSEYREKTEGVRGTGIAQIHIAITGTLTDSTSADISGDVRTRGASIQYPQLPKPITDITILSSFAKTNTKQELRVDELSASMGGTPMRMAMTVADFDDPFLNLRASGALNLATVHEYYPLEKGTALGGMMKLDVRLAGKVNGPKPLQVEGTLGFQDVSATTASLAKPVQKLNGTVTVNNEVAESKKLSMVIGGSDMTLAWKVKNYLSLVSEEKKAPQATATMSLQSNHLFVSDISKVEPAQEAGGSGTPSSKDARKGQKGQKKEALVFPDVDMDVTVSIGTLTLEKFEFSNVRGSLRVSNGLITMQNLSMNAFGGSVVSTGSVNLSKADQSPFDLKLNINAVQANSLLSPFTSFGQRLNGALSMNTTLKGALNDTMGLVANLLQGSGMVSIKDGTLKGVKINQSLASALSLPDLETVQFKSWGNDFAVENGRLAIKDLTITALNSQYVVSGSQGLDGSLDYTLALYLPESAGAKIKVSGFAGDVVNLFKDQSGRLKLDFNVGGTMDSPKLQMDTGSARKRVEEQAKQKLDAEKQKLGKQLQDKAGEALKKILKK